jgi:MerR family mercuric resistance operon transcriptional regulator
MDPENMRPGFSIGDLARRAGCRVETVRYYEREGLMPDPPRSEGGHRIYDADHMKRLSFIRRARQLGFTLDQVRSLLGLADSGDYTCADVKSATLSHREDIRGRIADLERLDAALTGLAKACDGNLGQDCAIFEALFDGRK